MSLLEEAIFERLYPRYQRTFGEPPPLQAASLDEAVAYMRSRLRAHSSETAQTISSRLAGASPAIRFERGTGGGMASSAG